jgi:hypothetical protein
MTSSVSIAAPATGTVVAPGAPVEVRVTADRNAGIKRSRLYVDRQLFRELDGVLLQVDAWTATTPGPHELYVEVELVNGAKKASPVVTVQVQKARPGIEDLPQEVYDTILAFENAVITDNWDLVRAMDPAKRSASDASLNSDDSYGTLRAFVVVPTRVEVSGPGVYRVRFGLKTNEEYQTGAQITKRFCITWDVVPGDQRIDQNIGVTLGETRLVNEEPGWRDLGDTSGIEAEMTALCS